MEVDEVAADGASSDEVRQSKSPMEKMRVRLAAENYNKPNSYQTMPDDSDDETTAGSYSHCANSSVFYCLLYAKYYNSLQWTLSKYVA